MCELIDNKNVFFLGCRGISKTYSTALIASVKAVLWPGTAIVVASATRKQAREVVTKITKIFIPNYPLYAMEIESYKDNQYDSEIVFRNGSSITVVTANENARGRRCNLLIIDEARLVKKDIIDSVLKKFMTAPRYAPFMDLPEYSDMPLELNSTVYLTSGWYSSHWCYNLFRDYAAMMLTDRSAFAAALPYQLSIKEKLLIRQEVEDEMSKTDFNEISWIRKLNSSIVHICCKSYIKTPIEMLGKPKAYILKHSA